MPAGVCPNSQPIPAMLGLAACAPSWVLRTATTFGYAFMGNRQAIVGIKTAVFQGA